MLGKADIIIGDYGLWQQDSIFHFMHKQGLSKVGGFWSGLGWAGPGL